MKTAEERREGYLMPTDTERREVARRLRGLEVCEFDGVFIDCGEVENVLGLVSDDGAWYEAEGVTHLADLIEPGEAEEWVTSQGLTKEQLIFDWWLSGRVMHELGFDGDTADRDEVERRLLARLMPEGYEWPRFEDGEPVRFGDGFLDHQGNERSVLNIKMWQEGGFEIGTGQGTYDWHSEGERVKRPVPKVLDADGVPTLSRVSEDGTVYLDLDKLHAGDDLTHAKPEPTDSWERIEDDANKNYIEYWKCDGIPCSDCPAIVDGKRLDERYNSANCSEAVKCDLVRRARALAERERGE